MTIVNRRNALIGWAIWNVTKRVANRKARRVASLEGGKPKKPLIGAAALAAAAGAALFLRGRKSEG